MNIQAVIESLPYADAANVFLYGESRGGMMVLQALRDGFKVRAAATFGVFTDLDAYLKEDPQAAAISSKILPGFEANLNAHVERRSAIRWADRISAPLLIMHGGNDSSVSPSHALQLAAILQRIGKPYEPLSWREPATSWTPSKRSGTNGQFGGFGAICRPAPNSCGIHSRAWKTGSHEVTASKELVNSMPNDEG